MIIDYSKNFRLNAMCVFPGWKQLHDAINNNETDSVRMAIGAIRIQIEPDEVVVAFEQGKLKQLYDRAKKMVAIRELENMWYDEYDKSETEINNKHQLSKVEQEFYG